MLVLQPGNPGPCIGSMGKSYISKCLEEKPKNTCFVTVGKSAASASRHVAGPMPTPVICVVLGHFQVAGADADLLR